LKTQTLKSLLILWNSQGLFQGDLNRVQQFSLSWIIQQEHEQRVDLLKVQTLAQNPDLYKAIFEPMAQEEEEWRTLDQARPIDEDAVLAEVQRWQAQREEL
jgi:hypothetical protein